MAPGPSRDASSSRSWPERPAQRLHGAVQMDADRGLRAPEHGRDLRRRQLFLDRQHPRRALLRREPLDGGPQARHRLLLGGPLPGVRLARGLSFDERDFILIALARHRTLPPAAAAAMIETQIDEDAIEPRREPRIA